ncbi:MAG: hypothetical protein LLF93_00015 [Bacteroidales bacterium]|nr:hypothetical protein [Bacteroidales bacterium]
MNTAEKNETMCEEEVEKKTEMNKAEKAKYVWVKLEDFDPMLAMETAECIFNNEVP